MSIRQLGSKIGYGIDIIKPSLTSDGLTGTGITFSGFENVLAIVSTNTPSTSAAVLTVSFQKAIAAPVASDNAASDWAAIASDCSIVAQAYAASTSTYVGVLDIQIASSDSAGGGIRASVATPGEGLTIDGVGVVYILYNGSRMFPDTDFPVTNWPA